MTNAERVKLLRACKWVDRTAKNLPYLIEIDTLDKLGVDVVLHGDDIIYNEHGESIYTKFEKVGRFRVFKRTSGISTTDIKKKLLAGKNLIAVDFNASPKSGEAQATNRHTLDNTQPRFLLNTSRLLQFGTARPVPEGARIVYFADAFDALSELTRSHPRGAAQEVQRKRQRLPDLRSLLR